MRPDRLLFAVIALLIAPTLFGRGLDKYKDWDQSPQGYFMTRAEREQWQAVKTDDDAGKFVNAFLANRPTTFVQDVVDRAAQADRYHDRKTAGLEDHAGESGHPARTSAGSRCLDDNQNGHEA